MWEQSWVVSAPSEDAALNAVQMALATWAPEEAGTPELGAVRLFRGPDDMALADSVARDLADIRQTVAQSHRQELSRRLHQLSHRAVGIPPRPGFVVLDGSSPRSPRPGDLKSSPHLRWVVTVAWPGKEPDLP
ncbi:hypothetical protein [Sulfobacillus harzensis]|uniref:Uncharacterized protein n=1 Tax=Sulfobacillus harzensis TaxID=2729629 RepID=A0A7Y0Q2F2_9FIRM|nr:hypothetical protein [Sulfobacillus harzensis]NMP21109.1 hypothetical protein [Sulfobacillus harzensis]